MSGQRKTTIDSKKNTKVRGHSENVEHENTKIRVQVYLPFLVFFLLGPSTRWSPIAAVEGRTARVVFFGCDVVLPDVLPSSFGIVRIPLVANVEGRRGELEKKCIEQNKILPSCFGYSNFDRPFQCPKQLVSGSQKSPR